MADEPVIAPPYAAELAQAKTLVAWREGIPLICPVVDGIAACSFMGDFPTAQAIDELFYTGVERVWVLSMSAAEVRLRMPHPANVAAIKAAMLVNLEPHFVRRDSAAEA